MKAIQAIILAGGKSSRMGEDKGLLELRGKYFIEHIINAISPLLNDIMIISSDERYRQFNLPLYADIIADTGPAGGVLTGLTYSKHEINLILSCDIPLVRAELPELLTDQYKDEKALICASEDRLHPLIGIYSKACTPVFGESIRKGSLKMLDILHDLDFKTINVPGSMRHQLQNINTQKEYLQIKHEHHY